MCSICRVGFKLQISEIATVFCLYHVKQWRDDHLAFVLVPIHFFSRSVIKKCINATNYGLQGTRNPMLPCDGTQLSCKHPFTIIILINPAKNNSLWDFKKIISQANTAQNLSQHSSQQSCRGGNCSMPLIYEAQNYDFTYYRGQIFV